MDLLTELAFCGWLFLLVGYCCFFVARKVPDRIVHLWRRVLPPLALLSLLAMSPALAQVAGRHWGEWSRLKTVLQDNEARVRALSSRTDGSLTEEEFARAKAWFLEEPVTFRFETEPEPVRLRLLRSVPPYVGVDFGQGRNAMFDPVTMRCVYSN
ncbi:hypothetical protein [Corallococcus aberystwythensis]|uniref:hypothetical protein n=1 Tax=Corallococcus aberystwythensis TaxID=2316722 RepID=UPI0011C3F17E|nr:hypothetical protein [Corallococcus aberystwythensis]